MISNNLSRDTFRSFPVYVKTSPKIFLIDDILTTCATTQNILDSLFLKNYLFIEKWKMMQMCKTHKISIMIENEILQYITFSRLLITFSLIMNKHQNLFIFENNNTTQFETILRSLFHNQQFIKIMIHLLETYPSVSLNISTLTKLLFS